MKMKDKTSILARAITLGLSWAAIFILAAQGQNSEQADAKPTHPHQYHHYQVVDVGTFGGPSSWMTNPAVVRLGLFSNQGTLTGEADTSVVDPFFTRTW
jgi:hypothetical protein